MTENTGRHILDSGMLYGYNYDRAQGANEQPEGWFDYGTPTINLYHHLVKNVRFNEDVQTEFDAFVAEIDSDNDMSWEDLLHKFTRNKHWEVKSHGYTYNFDNLLSQNFVWFDIETDDGDDMVIIRTHNGCDARGGFSSPKWFNFTESYSEDSNLTQVNTCYLFCNECGASYDNSYGDNQWRNRDDEVADLVEQDGKLLCTCGKVLEVGLW
jgi:hypothetical protein